MKACYVTEPQSRLGWLLYRIGLFKPKVHPELQQRINACRSMEELKDLLFSCGTLDEGGIRAFDRRIDELESTR